MTIILFEQSIQFSKYVDITIWSSTKSVWTDDPVIPKVVLRKNVERKGMSLLYFLHGHRYHFDLYDISSFQKYVRTQ